jgi:putative phosphoesterase
MQFGVISDTHGDLPTTLAAVRMFASFGVDGVIHCGDIGPPETVALFSPFRGHFVFGNMDDHAALRERITAAGHHCYERFGHLRLEGRSIAFLHGDDGRLLKQTVTSGRWDLVCHGHTHVAARNQVGGTLVLNPGAIQRTAAPSVAVVELPSLEVTAVAL